MYDLDQLDRFAEAVLPTIYERALKERDVMHSVPITYEDVVKIYENVAVNAYGVAQTMMERRSVAHETYCKSINNAAKKDPPTAGSPKSNVELG